MSPIIIAAAFVVGAAGWTLAEYVLHDMFHRTKGRNHGSRTHLQHHAEWEYFASSVEKAKAATVASALLLMLTVPWAGWAAGGAFVVGFVASYLLYEWVHRRLHTHPPATAFGRRLRKHHFAHHFRHPHQNHGVTNRLWDRVFGTFVPTDGPIRVPRRLAMRWLVDPDVGDVWPAHRDDYVLVGGGSLPMAGAGRAAASSAEPRDGAELAAAAEAVVPA